MVGRRSPQNPSISQLTLPPETIPSCDRRMRHSKFHPLSGRHRGHIKKFAIQTRKKDGLCFVQNEELIRFAEVIVRELCYTGVIHLDARLHDASQEIFLIEANPRFWGSLAEATSGGLNFVRAGIYTSMGLESADPITISDVCVP